MPVTSKPPLTACSATLFSAALQGVAASAASKAYHNGEDRVSLAERDAAAFPSISEHPINRIQSVSHIPAEQ